MNSAIGYSPIAIFAYKRPILLQRCLTALLNNVESSASDLYIFIDGPKSQEDAPYVDTTLKIAESVTGFKSVTVINQESNLGLAKSIRNGVDHVLSQSDRLIVLEDDLVVSPSFLQYMNLSLQRFATNNDVFSIQGSNYFSNGSEDGPFFLIGADCWGWGTWKDRWDSIDWDVSRVKKAIRADRMTLKYFNLYGSYSHTTILNDVASGRVSSWAVFFHAKAVMSKKFSLYPHLSQVNNLGLGVGATHMKGIEDFSSELHEVTNWILPEIILEDEDARSRQIDYFRLSRSAIGKFEMAKYQIKRFYLDARSYLFIR